MAPKISAMTRRLAGGRVPGLLQRPVPETARRSRSPAKAPGAGPTRSQRAPSRTRPSRPSSSEASTSRPGSAPTGSHTEARVVSQQASRRSDAPAVNEWTRGSRDAALAIARDPAAVEEALAELEAAEYAPNTRTAMGHRLALWSDICSAMGYSDPFALDPELIRRGAAVLRKARRDCSRRLTLRIALERIA